MLLNIIAFKNTAIKAFTNPQYLDLDADKAAVQLARSLTIGNKEVKTKYRELDMYFLGTFDDESGILTPIVPELILHCADYCVIDFSKEIEHEQEDK